MFPRAIRLLESGLINLNPVISRVVPLEDCLSAFDSMRRGEVVKLVIKVGDAPHQHER